MRNIKKILLIILSVFILLISGILIYVKVVTYAPTIEAKEVMESISKTNNLYIFEPDEAIANLIFYPGGFVDEKAYAVFLNGLKNEGIRVFLVSMPLKLAILNSNAAKNIYQTYPSDLPWYIMGHSLGGATASIFLSQNPNWIDGLILLASYPANSSDLSQSNINVISIYGDQDFVLDIEKVEATKSLLPNNTEYHRISGGNHAYFGHYGEQKGDGIASITRDYQQQLTIEIIIAFLENNS
ncbi:MAG: alpha/beta hydrolase [Acholeplasmataceae bacterium]|nr:alpha/beta hydrolase [Acholeplasmataceae bacterium]